MRPSATPRAPTVGWLVDLLPWVKAIEAEFARVVFNDPVRFHLELDLSAMMRGDFATQAGVGINLGACRGRHAQ